MNRRRPAPTIERMVATAAVKVSCNGSFTIHQIQLHIATKKKKLLTYKQTRNALYRLRERDGHFYHQRFGSYYWF